MSPYGAISTPAHLLLLEQIEVDLLPRVVLVRVAVQDRDVVTGALVLGAADDVLIERILAVEDDEPHRGADPAAQLASGVVAHVPEFLDGAIHPIDRVDRDLVGPVEDVGNGADGDARALGDVSDTRRHWHPALHRVTIRSRLPADLTVSLGLHRVS